MLLDVLSEDEKGDGNGSNAQRPTPNVQRPNGEYEL